MPITYTIDGEFLETEMSGDITTDDVLAYWKRLRADRANSAVKFALIHLHGISAFSSAGVRRLAEEAKNLDGSRRALLVTGHLSFGLLRKFVESTEQTNIRYGIFTDRQAALEWLQSEDEPAALTASALAPESACA